MTPRTARHTPPYHIREAAEFSSRMGGLDETVKAWFFALPKEKRKAVFDRYGALYGQDAKAYAQNAWRLWKSSRRAMSGLVAKRLFDCLPPLMPEREKYALAARLWERCAPSSSLRLSVGPSAPRTAVAAAVAAHFDRTVRDCFIPKSLRDTFRWLAEDDVRACERLLNSFVRQEKELACLEAGETVALLQRQKREHPELVRTARKTVRAGKHTVELIVEGPAGSAEVREWTPPLTKSVPRLGWLVAAASFVCFLLFR